MITSRFIGLVSVLFVILVAFAASAAEPVKSTPKCATAKMTVVDADGTIHIKTRTVCVAK